ncbi:MAG: CheR family methyltransferase [Thermodesulfobacteriota bacterium]
MKNILPLSEEDFGLFQELLMEKSGLQFEKSRGESLHFALWQRLQHRGYQSYREYYDRLRFHPEGRLELRELLDLITVGETYFFRNKPQFDVLMKFVLPEILQRKGTSREKDLRIWSAGCSRGDEAYSLAIAVLEVMPPDREWGISILGTDINRNGLACAKEGIYGEKGIAHLPQEYLDKYFEDRGAAYHIHTNVKDMVQFDYHNLASDPFLLEGMQRIDILFCRNVLIYFNAQTRGRVLENLYNCLAHEGYLFLGHSETLWQIPHRFERVEFPQAFLYRKGIHPLEKGTVPRPQVLPEMELEPVAATGTDSGKGIFSQERGLKLQEEPKPLEPAEKPSEPLFSPPHSLTAQDENSLSPYLMKATRLANEAKYEEAADILAKIVETDNLSAKAYYLLGALSYKLGHLERAETFFRKVLYVDPESVLAYFNLGRMYSCQQKFREAAREFRTAVRLLEKKPIRDQVSRYEDITVEFLLRACRNNLVEISKRGEGHE